MSPSRAVDVSRPGFRCRQCFTSVAIALLALAAIPVHAFDAAETLSNFHLTLYSKSDGVPGGMVGIAQTTDGFLWMTGTKGLVRFDGVQFKAFKPLQGEKFIQAQLGTLFPAEGGGLWIKNDNAGPTLLKNGHLSHFGSGQSYIGAAAAPFAIFTDPRGAVWSVDSNAIRYFKDGDWHVVDKRDPAEGAFGNGVFDKNENLWITVGGRGLMVKPQGSDQLLLRIPDIEKLSGSVVIGSSGLVYFTSRKNGIHIYRREDLRLTEVTEPIPINSIDLMPTRSGALWLISSEYAAYYVSPASLAQAEKNHSTPQYEVVPKLGNTSFPVFEDRSGDVWIGTESGVARMSHAAFKQIELPKNIHEISASVDASGGVWIGSETQQVLRVESNASSWVTTDVPKYTMATYADSTDGTIWGANPFGVWQLSPGKPRQVASFPGAHSGHVPYSVLRDKGGMIFVSWPRLDNGLVAWDGKAWRDVLSSATTVKVMAVDRQNRLWLGGDGRNRLVALSKGVERAFSEAENLQIGVVRSILVDGDVLWIGGDDGIQFFDGNRFTVLQTNDADAFRTVTGLILDADNNLWVQTLDRVMIIPANDIAEAMSHPGKLVSARSFDGADGVPATVDADRMLPSLRLSRDGRIWTHTAFGLAWIDPSRLPKQASLPPIAIETVSGGSAVYPASGKNVKLTAEQSSFRISYTIPVLNHPEYLKFAYRLDGFTDWQDVGTRREAVFTKVPAGDYQFQVRAIRSGDEKNAVTASLNLTRAPGYYETWWFHLLALLLLSLLLWVTYALRLRAVHRQLHIRVDERERIARDLHDTLLQGVQGLQLRLQTWAASPKLDPAHRKEISDVAARARDMLIDGRDRIVALRRVDALTDLAEDLRAISRDYTAIYHMEFALIEEGEARPLNVNSAQEILDISCEGLRNAFVHSDASLVQLHIRWKHDALHVLVRDDGKGIDESVIRDGGRAGHWGLLGMRERAARIGARLLLSRGDVSGTELALIVPAQAAYADASRSIWRLLPRIWGKSLD